MSYSGSGDVTAAVSTPSGDSRGCLASDFAGFPAGNIALIQRGTPTGFPVACTFALKATNALAAGAVGVVIYNNAAGPLAGTLGNTFALDVPVVGITQALGQAAGGHRRARAPPQDRDPHHDDDDVQRPRRAARARTPTTSSWPAPTSTRVAAGPGINDNGSGVGRPHRGRREPRQGQAAEHPALRVVGRRGGQPRRVDLLRHQPVRGGAANGSRSTSTST